jgi:predicted AAA+ superfamily ATPase
LPAVYPSDDYVEELSAYSALYLKEEIQNEALTRKLAHFSEFLGLMALSNGEEISYRSISGDCGVSAGSVKNHIQILEDTLVAFQLKAYTNTRKRKAISRAKLYLFDIGVTNSLARRGDILDGSELFGKAFEHFVLLEVRAFLSYARKVEKMYYWRSTSQFEVNLILDSRLAIEIKSAASIQSKHLKGLRALKEEGIIQNFAVVSRDRYERVTKDGIRIYPWQRFLEDLWGGAII